MYRLEGETMALRNKNPHKKFAQQNVWKPILVTVGSAFVGAGMTFSIIPFFQAQGFMPTTVHAGTLLTSRNEPVIQTVNLHVDDGITKAVKQVKPAVMGIVNYAQVSNFFTQQTKLEATGVGTGVLFAKDRHFGYVVTNNHVVEGAMKVDAVMSGGKHVQATVVGTDPYTDLAVLKLPIKDVQSIQPIRFCNSDRLQAGEPAIAIGTPMGLDFADSVTAGIVSAPKRIMPVEEPSTQQVLDYQTVIQTDAAINPGNSGGPLVNIDGEVMGINSSKIVAPEFEGMGFAIPANEAVMITNEIMKSGHAVHPSLGIEGYSLAALPEQWWPDVPVDYGVWIKSVTSLQTRASGLLPNDVIVGFAGHPIKTMADLRTYLFTLKPGQIAPLRIYRNQQELTLRLKVGKMDTQLTTATASNSRDSNDGDAGGEHDEVPFTSPF